MIVHAKREVFFLKKGFTLIELLIVISILAVLTLVFSLNNSDKIKKAEQTKEAANEKIVESALRRVQLEEGDIKSGEKMTTVDASLESAIRKTLKEQNVSDEETEFQKIKSNLYYLQTQQMRGYVKQFKDKTYAVVKEPSSLLNNFVFGLSKAPHVIDWNDDTNNIEAGKIGVKEGKIKSGSVTVYEVSNIDKVIKDVEMFNLNMVNVPIQVDIPNTTSSTFSINKTQFEQAKELIKKLQEKNIQVVVEPFPYIQNGGVSETEWNPSDINTFFWIWKTEVLQKIFDEITKLYPVYGVKIGSNMVHMEYAEGYWSDTIDFARSQYNGNIIFHTNWWTTAEWDQNTKNDFLAKISRPYWKKVDIIAVDGWFEITSKTNPSVDEVKTALQKTDIYSRNQNVIAELKQFHDISGKPIYFGGFNVPAKEKGLETPWDPDGGGAASPQTQYNGLAAYRSMLENEEWFKGFSLWFIGSNDTTHSYAIKKEETKQLLIDWYKK